MSEILKKLDRIYQKSILQKTILAVALDGVWMHRKDPSGYLVEYDDRFLEIMGYSSEQEYNAAGGWLGTINQEDMVKAVDLMSQHEKSHGEIPYVLYARYTHKDGRELKMLCRGQVIEWNEDGSYKIFVGSHTLLP